MFKQIIIAMAGAIAAQLTAATLDFTPSERRNPVEAQAVSPPDIVIATPRDFFVVPGRIAAMAPLLGASQIGN